MSGGNSRWAAALALTIAAVVAGGQLLPESLDATAASGVTAGTVQEATAVCPSMSSTADSAETVTTFSLPSDPAAEPTGQIAWAGADPGSLPPAGTGTRTGPVEAGSPVTVTATGGSVATTATVREYLDQTDEGRGLAMASCIAARSQWWFPGVSAVAGRIDELLLANPAGSPAVVTLEVFGPAGRVDLVGTTGMVVQPRGQASVRVDSLVPGTSNATIHVATSAGLVAAAVRSTSIDGLIPLGAEYVPAAVGPATRVVIPGVLPGAGERRLIITAPDADAGARVSLVTADGTESLDDSAQLPIPAGHTVAVELSDRLNGRSAAVVVSASAPVTAGVASIVEGTLAPDATGVLARRPVADQAFSAAQPPIGQQWRLPLTGIAAAPATVTLTSTGGPTTVAVELLAATGATWQQSVEVPAETTVEVAVPVTPDGPSMITLARTAGGGELHAAVLQIGALPSGPIAAEALGFDPSPDIEIPFAYVDPQVLSAGS